MDLGDDEIVSQFNNGNKRAFKATFEGMYAAIYEYACRFVPNDQASDITSDAFFKLWESTDKKDRFKSLQHIKNFLMLVARNRCYDYLDKKKTQEKSVKDIAYLSSVETPFWGETEDIIADHLRALQIALKKLPKRRRDIVKLAFYEGLNNADIARKLKIKEITVRNTKSIALKILRDFFKGGTLISLIYIYL
jgi:RNA polymerase sigma factor (sigma-70 family)